jgi:hypothetical protein
MTQGRLDGEFSWEFGAFNTGMAIYGLGKAFDLERLRRQQKYLPASLYNATDMPISQKILCL